MPKTTITFSIDSKVKSALERRAKKELLTLEELIIDILRRSVLSYKGGETADKVDDKFLTFFSRKSSKKLSK